MSPAKKQGFKKGLLYYDKCYPRQWIDKVSKNYNTSQERNDFLEGFNEGYEFAEKFDIKIKHYGK